MGDVARMTFVDVETTGLDPALHHVVEVAACVFNRDGDEEDRFQTLVNPGADALRSADPKAMVVNGITGEALSGAPPPEAAAAVLRHFLVSNGWPAATLVHSFNSEFDCGFLSRSPWGLADGWGECVMKAAVEVMARMGAIRLVNGQPRRVRLEEAARFFGVEAVGAHRALPDARMAANVHLSVLSIREAERAAAEGHLLEIARNERAMTPARLLKGAGVLGRIWRDGHRCAGGWSRGCGCAAPTVFCQAKARWINLLDSLPPGHAREWTRTNDGPLFAVEAMTVDEAEASGLTFFVLAADGRRFVFGGQRGTCWKTLRDLRKAPEAGDAVAKIQKVFASPAPPGAPVA